MFDLWSLIIGLLSGGSLGIPIVALLHVGGLIDDEPEYWFKQLGRRESDR